MPCYNYTPNDYISCIDSEIMFIRKNIFYDMMKAVCENRVICGGIVNDGDFITTSIIYDSLTRLINPDHYDDLIKLSQNIEYIHGGVIYQFMIVG